MAFPNSAYSVAKACMSAFTRTILPTMIGGKQQCYCMTTDMPSLNKKNVPCGLK